MKCFVWGCNNTYRSKGITLYTVPNEPAIRKVWLQALGIVWEYPKWNGVLRVCSEHFLYKDVVDSKNKSGKSKANAVPVKHLKKCNLDELPAVEVCRVCLAMDTKMFNIFEYDLKKCFKQVTGITLFEKERLPHWLCFECARCMVNSFEFQQKSVRANVLMLKLIQTDGMLSHQNIRTINRENHLLTSKLGIKRFDADHYDFLITEEEEEIEQDEDPEEIHVDYTAEYLEEIKDEDTAEYLEEIKDEDTAEYLEEIKDEDTAEYLEEMGNEAGNIFVNELDADKSHFEVDHHDYIAGYSSDDGLPLEANKTKEDGDKIKEANHSIIKDKEFCDLFTFQDLTMEEQLADIEKRKESFNYKNSFYQCPHCYKGFLEENTYDAHMLRHSKKCGDYECGICKIRFKTERKARIHILSLHAKRYSCKQCEYITKCRVTARSHMRWHKGSTYTCPHCGINFSKCTTYLSHLRIKHPSDFVCQLCGFSYLGENGLRQHKAIKHMLEDLSIPEDGPLCDLCDIRFVNVAALNKHLSVSPKHKAEGSLVRNDPKPSEVRKLRPNAHRSLTKEPIPCEQCGIQLSSNHAYYGHFRRLHPEKNRTRFPGRIKYCMCEQCGKILQNQAKLKDHLWMHSGERPFQCESCGKSFPTKKHVMTHKKQFHSKQHTTYACEVCGKHFKWYSNRQKHMLIHVGVKPYKCEMCDKTFKFPSEKRTHIAHTHLKKPWPKRNRGKRVPKEKQVAVITEQLSEAGME